MATKKKNATEKKFTINATFDLPIAEDFTITVSLRELACIVIAVDALAASAAGLPLEAYRLRAREIRALAQKLDANFAPPVTQKSSVWTAVED